MLFLFILDIPGQTIGLAGAAVLEALLAAWLIQRLATPTALLHRINQVFRFILVAILAPLPAALIAVLSVAPLDIDGTASLTMFTAWWLGDSAGILVFAPVLLAWSSHQYAPPAGRTAELLLFALSVAAASVVVFGSWLHTGSLVYLLLTFFLWASLRLEARGTSVLALFASLAAAYFTSRGIGPLVAPSAMVTQLTLQLFAAVAAVAGLVMNAVMYERDEAQDELRLSDRILNASPEHISVVTPQYAYRRVNRAYEEAHAMPASEIVGMSVSALLGEDIYQQVVRPNLERAFAGREVRYSAWFDFDGEGRRHMLVTYVPLPSVRGDTVDGVAVLSRDITDLKLAEEKLQLAGSVIENTPEGVMITDADLKIISVNPAFSRNTGYSEDEIIGRTPSVLSSGRHSSAFYRQMWQALEQDGHWQGEIWNRRRNGDIYVEWLSIVAIYNGNGDVSHYAGLFSDITTQEHVRNRLHSLAYFDALTDLPNRELFNDRLQNALAQGRREQRQVALMFLDLDRFKQVNDTHGHLVGDELLRRVAEILRNCVRESDTVARLGGDEFSIVLPGVARPDDVTQVARKIIDSFAEPIRVAGHDLQVSTSIGIALYPYDGADAATLLRHADTAMYAAKQAGRNTYLLFEPKMAQLLGAERS